MRLKYSLLLLSLLLTFCLFAAGHSQQPTPSPTASPTPPPTATPSPNPSPLETESPSEPPPPTAAPVDKVELHQTLLDLTNLSTVMCVAAHPDDEDGTTLTVLRRKYGVHTVSLFSTYGEGGQNAIGPELYEELGVIRSQETMNAARIQGSEAYFLGLKDFGFSKSADEAFRVWGHEEALRRMVLKIRELRPDVIITNHDTTSGHGHHQATGRLVLEAFDAAADPQRFPEQLKQMGPWGRLLETWQVKRLFVRARRPAQGETVQADKVVVVDPNEMDQLRHSSYGAQALVALQQHATQGPWPKTVSDWLRAQNNQTGKLSLIRYQLVREAPGTKPLPTRPSTFLDDLFTADALNKLAPSEAVKQFALDTSLTSDAGILDALIDWRRFGSFAPASPDDYHRIQLLDRRIGKAFAVAAGIVLKISAADDVLVPGTSTKFTVYLANAGNSEIKVNKVTLDAWREKARLDAAEQLVPDSETSITVERTTPKTASISVPKPDHLYDGTSVGIPFTTEANLEIEGAKFAITQQLSLAVAPPVEIQTIVPSPCVRTEELLTHCNTLNVTLVNHLRTPFKGKLTTKTPNQQATSGPEIKLDPGESATQPATADSAVSGKKAFTLLKSSGLEVLSVVQSSSNEVVSQRTVAVNYSAAKVLPHLRVGYVRSFDSTLQDALASLAVENKELTIEDVEKSDLSGFSTIVIDNRGYEAHPELIGLNSRLLDYVRNGGTLIVFYHKDNEWNPDEKRNRPQLAPYPIVLGGERVTDETATIKILEPNHPLLRYPNRITAGDFDNWIQERGLYYPKEWDPHYTAIFSTNDPGEKPLNGGLLVTKYGKGNYIYTSMVWYRQLRAGVSGGYRMFANMISYRNSRASR